MNYKISNDCPVCGTRLRINRLTCPECKAEFPTDKTISPYDCLPEELSAFLETFLICRGNMKDVQRELNISYITAKKKLDSLIEALQLCYMVENEKEETTDMNFLKKEIHSEVNASDIIKKKLWENGGRALVYSINGKEYTIKAEKDGKTFASDALPIGPNYEYSVFDVIVDLLIREGGRAAKGNGRNFKFGQGNCTEDTVVGAIAKYYAGRQPGESVFDPVFILAAILEWAGVVNNCRGYIEFTPEYRQLLASKQL